MSSDWHLGEVLYKKWPLYKMSWKENMHVEDYRLFGAPYGGPVAAFLDSKKKNSPDILRHAQIYSSSGLLIAELCFICLTSILRCMTPRIIVRIVR